MYVRSNGVWSEQQKLTASDGARMIILAQRLDRRRYGCDWCLLMMTMAYSGSAYIFPLTPPRHRIKTHQPLSQARWMATLHKAALRSAHCKQRM